MRNVLTRKNIPLIAVLILSAGLVTWRMWREMLPGWPGYGIKEYISVNAPVVALTHVRIIDGSGAFPVEDSTIVLAGGKIQAIGKFGAVSIPPQAQVLDLTGRTVIPGIVGMHDHMFYPSVGDTSAYTEMGYSFPRLYLASGVTTVRTAGAIQPATDLRLKSQIDKGWLAGPKMHVTGPYLDSLPSPEAASALIDEWANKGATSVKVYMRITRSQLAAAIATAHRRGIKVTGHLCAVGFREAVGLGIDNLEHGLLVDTEFDPGKEPDVCPAEKLTESTLAQLDVNSAPVQEMIRDLVQHHVAVTSTLPVFETFVPDQAPEEPAILDTLFPASREDYLRVRGEIAASIGSPWAVLLKKEMEFERAFVASGGLLLAGEDPTGFGGDLAGFGDQREIELLVKAGFTPLEAIHIATANGAEYLGESDLIGTLAAGKQADLVVINGNPAERIDSIELVETVFKDGVGYNSPALIQSVRNSVGLR